MLLPENTKCECGHQNGIGTILCESCGKPLDPELAKSNEVLEMRYDGVARPSQKANPNFIDKIWNFFSSVKVAIYLILITLILVLPGAIIQQADTFLSVTFDPSTYYKETYGTIGHLLYLLGFHNTFESWWFKTLLVLIAASLVICSIDRVVPLYRALNKQQIKKHLSFLRRQKATYTGQLSQDQTMFIEQFGTVLKKKHYRVHIEGQAILAEKYRFSRWGPYINHIGLIIILITLVFRSFPGLYMDSYVKIVDGDTVPITDTNFYVKSEGFDIIYYENDELPDHLQDALQVKSFETDVILYECVNFCDDVTQQPELKPLMEHKILVNSPLSYKGFRLHQFDYDLTPRLNAVSPSILDKATGETYGPFDLSMCNPDEYFEVGPYQLKLLAKYMDFILDSNGEPTTQSSNPNAPAFIFNIKGPGLAESGENYMYFPLEKDKVRFSQDTINRNLAEKVEFKVLDMNSVDFSKATTYLNVRYDPVVKYLLIGAFICMFGLTLGSYWNHRRIWVRFDEQTMTIGAHTNKNWFAMRQELASCLKQAGIDVDQKDLDNGGNKT